MIVNCSIVLGRKFYSQSKTVRVIVIYDRRVFTRFGTDNIFES